MSVKTFLNQCVSLAKKHSAEILTFVGIGGWIGTTVLVAKEAPIANERIKEEKERTGHRKLTTLQTIKVAGRTYIPAICTGALSTTCIIGACRINIKQKAALTAACTLSETALLEYKDKVIQTIGERKETAIREAIDKDKVERNPPPTDMPKLADGDVRDLCYDAMFGRYFYSNMNLLREAANRLNWRMTQGSETYVSLNEFYSEIDVPTVEIGDRLGWNVSRGLIKLRFSSQLTPDGRSAIVMSYETAPMYEYY